MSTIIQPNIDKILQGTKTFDRAKQVQIVIGTWQARKKDAGINTRSAHNEIMDEEMLNTTKRLLKPEVLSPILKEFQKIRTFHYGIIMPFGQMAILPNAKVSEYQEKIDDLIDNAYRVRNNFFANDYQYYREDAKRLLNGNFNEKDYPDPFTARNKFYARYTILDMPSIDNKLTGLDDYQRAKLANNINDYFSSAIKEALQAPFQDIIETIGHVVNVTKSGGTFRDVTFDKLGSFADHIRECNIFDDPTLADLANQISKDLANIDPDSVRKDDGIRLDVKDLAQAILDKAQAGII